jgi:hypothetical protein
MIPLGSSRIRFLSSLSQENRSVMISGTLVTVWAWSGSLAEEVQYTEMFSRRIKQIKHMRIGV